MGGAQFRALAHPDRRGGKPLLEFLGIDFAQAFFAEDVLRDAFHVSGDRGVKRSEAVVARGSQNQDGLEGEGEGKRLDDRVIDVFEVDVVDSAVNRSDLIQKPAGFAEIDDFGVLAGEGHFLLGDVPAVIEVVDDLGDEGFEAGRAGNPGPRGDVAIAGGEEAADIVAELLQSEKDAFGEG